jgi:hypothetical protein
MFFWENRFGSRKPTIVGWQDISASKRQWIFYKNISTGRNFDKRSASISGPALLALLPNRPLRNRVCTPLFLLLTGHGNPSQWTTCRESHPPSEEMTVFLSWFIAFLRWRFWLPARRASQQRPLPSSSLNESGYILESHKPLSQIRTVNFLAHYVRASGHCWTPSSPNPWPSTPRQMAKLRL